MPFLRFRVTSLTAGRDETVVGAMYVGYIKPPDQTDDAPVELAPAGRGAIRSTNVLADIMLKTPHKRLENVGRHTGNRVAPPYRDRVGLGSYVAFPDERLDETLVPCES